MKRPVVEWLKFVRHPKYPHGQLAVVVGKSGNTRRIGAVFDERANPNRPRGCPAPPLHSLFTVEFYFPQIVGRGADNVIKCPDERAAKRELAKRFLDFINDLEVA